MLGKKPTPAESRIWQQRWDVTRAAIDAAIATLPGGLDRRADFECLLHNLRGFAEQQVGYFLDGLLTLPEHEVGGFTRETALAVTLLQVGHDLAAITQAAHQRYAENPSHPDSAAILKSLQLSDRITANMLQPAVDRHLLFDREPFDERPIVLTYFQKYPSIRVMPYAPFALVGVPYSTIEFSGRGLNRASADLLAIPHEVGHYVYWNGHGWNGNGLRTRFFHLMPRALADRGRRVPAWTEKWGEEVFADVYGAFVAGPMIGIDFQDLQLHTASRPGMTKDDGEHPTPVVRPEVYVRALSEQGANGWAKALGVRWDFKLDGRGIARDDDAEVAHSLSGGRTIQLGTMRRELGAVVNIAHKLLAGSGLSPFDQSRLNLEFPDGAPETPENLTPFQREEIARQTDGLYQSWQRMVEDEAKNGAQPASKLRGCDSNFWTKPTWERWRDDLIAESTRVWGMDATEDNKWAIILQAGGWTTEGPESNPPQ